MEILDYFKLVYKKMKPEKQIQLKNKLESKLGRKANDNEIKNSEKDAGLIIEQLQEDVENLENQMVKVLKKLKIN